MYWPTSALRYASGRGGIMEGERLDRTRGQVNQLTNSLNGLGEAMKAASEASDRQARSLVRATWTLAGVTIVLVIVTAGSLTPILLERSPEDQAKRDIERCTAQAREMMARIAPGRALSDLDVHGYTMACLNAR